MSIADNEKRAGGRLRVGLLAPTAELAGLAAAIRSVTELDLCAHSGGRPSDALADVPWFDDARVMLSQGGVELLVVGGSPREAIEQAAAALENGVSVWRRGPLGRTFAEAISAARAARVLRPLYRIASSWEASEPAVHDVMHAAPALTAYSYVDLYVARAGPAVESWRASQTDSGGGVLIHEGYELLEGLVALRGLPETVSSALGAFRQRRGQPARDGEDTVAAVLRYADGAIASLRCGWDIFPENCAANYYGEESSLTIEDGQVSLRSSEGSTLRTASRVRDPHAIDLARTFQMIRNPDSAATNAATYERHLAVTAVIDTIYLAARTQQPESPHKLYEVQGWPPPQKR